MYYKIENDYMTAEIDDMGAQLHSVKSKEDSWEYLWQGDVSVWYGQAPVLFPFIGQLLDNKFRYNGAEYECPKHGFARHMLFEVEACEGSRAVFVLNSSGETLKMLPFKFRFSVIFELVGNSIKVTQKVENLSDGEMWFSCGAHPGFNCQIGDALVFEKAEKNVAEKIGSDNLVLNEKFGFELEGDNVLRLTPTLFEKDALILSSLNSEKVTLQCASGKNVVFNFGKCPFLGIWAKPNAAYVCIEPWYGVNDDANRRDDISQKRGIQRLDKSGVFDLVWSAEF